MKGLAILVSVFVLAFIAFLWAPDPDGVPVQAVTAPAAIGSPIIVYPPFEIPPAFYGRPEIIERQPQLDCLVGDFTQDKGTDPNWNWCPMLI